MYNFFVKNEHFTEDTIEILGEDVNHIKNVLRLKPYTEWAEYNRRGRNINATRYSAFRIPLPPIPVQKEIINECSIIDKEYESTRISIETYRKKIEDLFDKLDVANRGGVPSKSFWHR